MAAIKPAWIALDWGTTRARAWALSDAGDVLASQDSTRGMGTLAQGDDHGAAYAGALLDLIGAWLDPEHPIEVWACGMVGSRQGWVEAPYASVPATAADLAAGAVSPPDVIPGAEVHIVAGLCQHEPPDVIRGEETQVLGLLTAEPDFSGLVCLPGTHSKWIQLEAGQFSAFHTAMTGELFQAIATHTVLRHTVTTDWMNADAAASAWVVFDRAVRTALTSPAAVATALFQSRAASLVANEQPPAASARLSGLLIGLELAAMRGWLSSQPVICGAPALVELYQRALSALDRTARPIDAASAVISGLARIRAARTTQR